MSRAVDFDTVSAVGLGSSPMATALDMAHAKHPDMVLLHGGSPRGAERIAACWADSRKIVQIVFKPDWTKHRNAAPFKRNDQMLDALPVGLIAFPGSGIDAGRSVIDPYDVIAPRLQGRRTGGEFFGDVLCHR